MYFVVAVVNPELRPAPRSVCPHTHSNTSPQSAPLRPGCLLLRAHERARKKNAFGGRHGSIQLQQQRGAYRSRSRVFTPATTPEWTLPDALLLRPTISISTRQHRARDRVHGRLSASRRRRRKRGRKTPWQQHGRDVCQFVSTSSSTSPFLAQRGLSGCRGCEAVRERGLQCAAVLRQGLEEGESMVHQHRSWWRACSCVGGVDEIESSLLLFLVRVWALCVISPADLQTESTRTGAKARALCIRAEDKGQ